VHELDLDKHHQDEELVRDQEETDVLAKYLDGDVKVDADVFAVICDSKNVQSILNLAIFVHKRDSNKYPNNSRESLLRTRECKANMQRPR